MIPANELLQVCSNISTANENDATVTTVSAFKSSIKREGIALEDAPIYFEALLTAYDAEDAALRSVTFSAICYLSRRILILDESALTDQLALVLPLFIDNFAGPDGPASASKLAIRTFEDVWLAFPAETEQALRAHGLNHSRPTVRACSIQVLSHYIEKTPKFPFRKFTPSVTRLLNDSDPNVAGLARDLIVQFFSAAIPRAREDLKREMSRQKIDSSITNEIWFAIGEPKPEQRPASRQASSNGPKPAQANSSTIETIKALPDFELENLDPEDVLSVEQFRKDIERMAEQVFVGKESESNWRARETSLIKLRKLLRGNMLDHPGDVVWALKRLQDGIVKGISSLRTTLAAQACFLIKDAVQIYQTYMDPAIEPFLTALVKLCSGSKKISASHANVAICAMILSTSYSLKYVSHISTVMGDRVAAARALAIVWLDLLISRHRGHLIAVWQSQGFDVTAGDCIQRGLTDSAPAVRAASRPTYWSFAACFSDRANQIIAKLDPVQKKMLLALQSNVFVEVTAPAGNTAPEPTQARRSVSEAEVSTFSTEASTEGLADNSVARRSFSERAEQTQWESPNPTPAMSERTERVSERLSERISEHLSERRESSDGQNVVTVLPDTLIETKPGIQSIGLLDQAELVQKGAELLKERIEQDPETKKTVEEVSKLVEATAREAEKKAKAKEKDSKAESPKAEPVEGETTDNDTKEGQDENVRDAHSSEGAEAEDAQGSEDASPTGAIDEAVEIVRDKLDCDPEKLKSKLSSLSEMLSSEDIGTLNQGVSCLSYVLRGKSVPDKLAKDLVSIDLPDPDIIGRALDFLFSRVGDEMDPEIKETVAKFVSPDLVAVSLEYIGHAAVLWAAVNLLPAEVVLIVFEVVKPLVDVGTLVEAIFDVVTSDSPAESATVVCGQLLLRLDKVPLNDMMKARVQQVLSMCYRFGDLAEDVAEFINSWFDHSDDEKASDDSDSDEEDRARRQSHKEERAALANTSGSLITIPRESQTPDISVYSDPVITSHKVSVSFVPKADSNKATPKLKLHKIATPASRRTTTEWGLPLDAEADAAVPPNIEARQKLLVDLIQKLEAGTVKKREFIQLSVLCSHLDDQPRSAVEKLERAVLHYIEGDRTEPEVTAGLHIVRQLLDQKQYSTAVEHTLVLQTLLTVCAKELSARVHYAAVPETRDALFESPDFDISGTILLLVDLYTSSGSGQEKRRPRVFVLQSLRRLVPQIEVVPSPLGEIVHAALEDEDVYIRKEAYPVLLQIHQKSEAASGLLKARMSQGQWRLFQYYAGA